MLPGCKSGVKIQTKIVDQLISLLLLYIYHIPFSVFTINSFLTLEISCFGDSWSTINYTSMYEVVLKHH